MKKVQELKILNASLEKPFSAEEIFPSLKADFLNGFTNQEKVYVYLHQMSELFKMLKEDEDCKISLEKIFSLNKDSKKYGFVWNWIERRNYKYEELNDPILSTISEEIKAMTQEKKNRETVLRAEKDVPLIRIRYPELKKVA